METLASILLGILSKKFIDRMKKHGIDPFEALIFFCLLVGSIYAIFKLWLPTNFQESILSFASTAGLAAVATHETIKRINAPKS